MPRDLFYTRPDIFPYAPLRPSAELQAPASVLAPEYRRDPITGRWVIVAPERSLRPMSLEAAEPRHRVGAERRPCPFCPGQEYDTPYEVFAFREPDTARDGPGWRLRVVPNRYPAVRDDSSPSNPSPGPSPKKGGEEETPPSIRGEGAGGFGFSGPGGLGSSLFDRFPGLGRHEVVIESNEHVSSPAKLSDEQLRDVFAAYRERLTALAADPDLHYASVFKNVGAEAGASLGHCHSQIVATPMVPEILRRELRGADDYYTAHRRCVFCDIVKEELASGSRVVAETANFVAVTAFAGRFAYETWVLPKQHGSRYEAISNEQAGELAGLMKRLVQAMDSVLAEPAYNWYLHTAPLRSAELPYYHWHFEIIPRTSRPAGFEWGTGCFVNAVAPEQGAFELRNAARQ